MTWGGGGEYLLLWILFAAQMPKKLIEIFNPIRGHFLRISLDSKEGAYSAWFRFAMAAKMPPIIW